MLVLPGCSQSRPPWPARQDTAATMPESDTAESEDLPLTLTNPAACRWNDRHAHGGPCQPQGTQEALSVGDFAALALDAGPGRPVSSLFASRRNDRVQSDPRSQITPSRCFCIGLHGLRAIPDARHLAVVLSPSGNGLMTRGLPSCRAPCRRGTPSQIGESATAACAMEHCLLARGAAVLNQIRSSRWRAAFPRGGMPCAEKAGTNYARFKPF